MQYARSLCVHFKLGLELCRNEEAVCKKKHVPYCDLDLTVRITCLHQNGITQQIISEFIEAKQLV